MGGVKRGRIERREEGWGLSELGVGMYAGRLGIPKGLHHHMYITHAPSSASPLTGAPRAVPFCCCCSSSSMLSSSTSSRSFARPCPHHNICVRVYVCWC